MFPLHETTQRRVCRVLFIVCCVLPTLLTVGWIAHFYRPWRLSDWQQMLTQQLHLHATVSGIASPQPGVTTLTGVQLSDLRSDKSLGRIGQLHSQWQDSRLSLHADLLEIEVLQLPQVAEALATWLSTSESVPLDVQIDRVVFLGGPFASATWKNLRLTSAAAGDRGKRVTLKVDPAAAGLPVQLVVEHQGGPAGPSLQAELDTLESSFPAWLLADLIPGGVHRSPAANFAGKVQFKWLARQMQGTLQGQFSEVDLAQWLGSATPHRLQGIATLKLKKLVWQGRRIQLAEGQLQATRGATNRSLLAATNKLLECPTTPKFERMIAGRNESGSDELVPFDQLGFSFRLDSTGLGITSQSPSGCLLSHQGEQLMQVPPSSLPVTRLVRLLYLPVAGWLPDTQEAHNMASELPLPKSMR